MAVWQSHGCDYSFRLRPCSDLSRSTGNGESFLPLLVALGGCRKERSEGRAGGGETPKKGMHLLINLVIQVDPCYFLFIL